MNEKEKGKTTPQKVNDTVNDKDTVSAPDPIAPEFLTAGAPEEKKPDALDLSTETILAGLGYGPPAKKKEEVKPTGEPEKTAKTTKTTETPEIKDSKPPETEPEKKTEEKAGAPKAPEAPPLPLIPEPGSPPALAPTPGLTAEMIRDVAQEVAKAMAPARKDEPPDPAMQREVAVYERLAKDNPKYAGVAEQYQRGMAALKAYQSRWENEHPGEEFDPEADEHHGFMGANFPEVDEGDFEDARIKLGAEPVVKKILDEYEKKRREEAAQSRVMERIQSEGERAQREFARLVAPDLVEKVDLGKGIAQLRGVDRVAGRVLEEGAAVLRGWVEELEKLADPDLKYQAPEGHPIHQFAYSAERGLRQMPDAERAKVLGWLNAQSPQKAGRTRLHFVTLEEWNALPAAQKRQAYTLDPDDFKAIAINEFAQRARIELEARRQEYREYALAQGWVKNGIAPGATPKNNTTNPPDDAIKASNPPSPSTASSTDVVNPPGLKPEESRNLAEVIAASMWPVRP